jgi:hypothetical protein
MQACRHPNLESSGPAAKVVVLARVRRPRDKAKSEVGGQVVERWISARLRHRTFRSLAEPQRGDPRAARAAHFQAIGHPQV